MSKKEAAIERLRETVRDFIRYYLSEDAVLYAERMRKAGHAAEDAGVPPGRVDEIVAEVIQDWSSNEPP